MSSCCEKPIIEEAESASCCGSSSSDGQSSVDYMLWSCLALTSIFYFIHVMWPMQGPESLQHIAHTVFELINTMWWSVVLAAIFVGLLSKIPQDFVTATLGQGGSVRGLFRATLAGVFMDLCSHGILMVGMKLYQKGASLGQVMAFLIASPWNSLSLTLIMIALIGLPWTLAFIALSMVIAWITGYLFDRLVDSGSLPANPNQQAPSENFEFVKEARKRWRALKIDRSFMTEVYRESLSGSQMVVRWLLFGVLLAAMIRGFVALEDFQHWFGPGLMGLAATLLAATIIEVCSEGSTPIAADLMTRAKAPGNSFAFLMTGVATDYTEVMVIKDTMKSWKIALFLPLLTVPQVVVVALVLNGL